MLLFVVVQFTTELRLRANVAMHREGVVLCAEGSLCPLLRSRPASTAAVAPHQEGHERRLHGYQKESYQLDDRRDEAFMGHHRAVVHHCCPGTHGYQARPAWIDVPKSYGKPEQEEVR